MATEFLLGLGYLGAFLAGVISSVTLFLPTPGFIAVFLLGALFDPLLVGLLAGLGAAIGEMLGYVVGYGSDKFIFEKRKKWKSFIDKIEHYFNKYHPTVVIFIFAALPLPFDVVGIICGSINYSPKKFFIATLAGKVLKYVIIAYAGFYGTQWALQWLGL